MIKIKRFEDNGVEIYHIYHRDHWWNRWKKYDYDDKELSREWILSRINLLLGSIKEMKISSK